ncbi:hypothetical protein ABGN05_05610 [Aquibium sp. LZ166]|uniref:VWFA domain-containing protein n=1 Tax=Aquibium pacificus TaxID=3153579 RepID=A0ABV3SGX0_9HYPH
MITKPLILALFFAAFAPAIASAEELLVQVVVDDSGVTHDERDPQGKSNFNRFLTEFFNALARAHRRDRQATTIRVISAKSPPLTLWSGYASDFARDGIHGKAMKDLVGNKPSGCNDIPTALEEAQVNLAMSGSARNTLYLITSGVHSGQGCTELTQDGYVKLVESVDDAMVQSLGAASEKFDQVSVQFLATTQRRLMAQKLSDRAVARGLRAQGESIRLE